MSIHESNEESSSPSSEQDRKSRARRTTQSSLKAPVRAEASSDRSRHRSNSSTSYRVFKRDVLYRAINEFQLSGSKLSAYTDLLTRLGFDLSPLVSQGETWYPCHGRRDDDSRCRRMVPEEYFRTAVGGILCTADATRLKGDDLVEELATSMSYAICAEHHPTIHKIARALDARKMVQQWREAIPAASGSTTPNRARSPSFNSSTLRSSSKWKSLGAITVSISPPSKDAADLHVATKASDEQDQVDPIEAYGMSERLKVERHYQQYLRASSRERRSNSDAGSRTSSKVLLPPERRLLRTKSSNAL